jgi:hypothetical protein
VRRMLLLVFAALRWRESRGQGWGRVGLCGCGRGVDARRACGAGGLVAGGGREDR